MATVIPGKWIHKVIGGVMLVGVIVAFLPAILATRELKKFCEQLAVGTPMADVQLQLAKRAYRGASPSDGRLIVDDTQSFGRPTCDIRYGERGVLTAEYSTND